MASQCRCCVNLQTESLCDMFIHSDIATAVWKSFGEIFHLPYHFHSKLQAIGIWMAPTSKDTQYGICHASVAAYIFREIWVSRCSATFENKLMKARAICLMIFRRVQLINLAPTGKATRLHENSLAMMGINRASIRKKMGCVVSGINLLRDGLNLM